MVYVAGGRTDHRAAPFSGQALISGPALARTSALVSGTSKPPLGVGLLPTSRSIELTRAL